MNPENIPFNVLVVRPTNSGKSQFVVDRLYDPFRGKFDYIVLISPTTRLSGGLAKRTRACSSSSASSTRSKSG